MDHATLYILVGLAVVTLGVLGWQIAVLRAARRDQEKRIRALEARPATALDAGTAALLAQVQTQIGGHERRLEVVEDEMGSAWMAWADFVASGGRVGLAAPLSRAKKKG